MSWLRMTMIITMCLSMPVIATMRLMQDFHIFEFVTLARNESE